MTTPLKIVLDTETTGLSASDVIIEIGAVEIDNNGPTGRHFHSYINPNGRKVNEAAYQVHGISDEFLADKPPFRTIAPQLLEFIGTNTLVIHNASFDVQFLNRELALSGFPAIKEGRILCTLMMARRKYPGSPASLDALCRRFGVSLKDRSKHGALLDAELLSQVYSRMNGVQQTQMDFSRPSASTTPLQNVVRLPRTFSLTADEAAAHAESLKKIDNPIWGKLKIS